MDKLPVINNEVPEEDDDLSCDVNLDDDDEGEITGLETDEMLETKITSSKVFGTDFSKKKSNVDSNEVILNNEDKENVAQSTEPEMKDNLVLNENNKGVNEEDVIVKKVRKKRKPPSQKTLDALKKGREKGLITRRKQKLERIERERKLLLNDEKEIIKTEIKNEAIEKDFNDFLHHYNKMKEMKIRANSKTEKLKQDKLKSDIVEMNNKQKLEEEVLLELEKKKNLESLNLLQPQTDNPYANYFT